MYYLFHGNNTEESRKKAGQMLLAMQKKRPESELIKIGSDNWDENIFKGLIGAQGLFDTKYIISLDMREGKEMLEVVASFAEDMKESQNAFVILSEALLVKYGKSLKEDAFKETESKKLEEKRLGFNVFSLAEALGRKDKKSLWVGYLHALSEGVSPEEITGVLFWQIKNTLIAMQTKSVAESKLSPYADKNARGFAKNFTKEELTQISEKLIDATDAVRNGEGEMEVLLEGVLLKI